MWKPSRKWTMKAARALDDKDIFKMNTQQLAELGQYYYQQFHRRVTEGIREGVLPYGVRKMYNDLEKAQSEMVETPQGLTSVAELMGYDLDVPVLRRRNGMVELSENFLRLNRPRNALMSYVFSMREFFSWKSSSVAGWRKIARQQDINLFGADENGNPLYTMNEAERLKFWELYEELKRRGTVEVYADGRFNEGFITMWRDIAEENAVHTVDTTKLIQRIESKIGRSIAFPEYDVGNVSNPSAPAYDEEDIWAGDVWGRRG